MYSTICQEIQLTNSPLDLTEFVCIEFRDQSSRLRSSTVEEAKRKRPCGALQYLAREEHSTEEDGLGAGVTSSQNGTRCNKTRKHAALQRKNRGEKREEERNTLNTMTAVRGSEAHSTDAMDLKDRAVAVANLYGKSMTQHGSGNRTNRLWEHGERREEQHSTEERWIRQQEEIHGVYLLHFASDRSLRNLPFW